MQTPIVIQTSYNHYILKEELIKNNSKIIISEKYLFFNSKNEKPAAENTAGMINMTYAVVSEGI